MWYVIAWRDETPSTMTLDIPGFDKWCDDNREMLNSRIDSFNRYAPGRRITPDILIDAWNANWPGTVGFRWNPRLGAIETDTFEYSVRVEMLPERMAPHIEMMDPEDGEYWWWYGVDKDGNRQFRHVLDVESREHLEDAFGRSKWAMKHFHDVVEKFDTEEWVSERKNLRRQYDDFRNWVISLTQHNPPEPEREPG
jgi:hypothetical protein